MSLDSPPRSEQSDATGFREVHAPSGPVTASEISVTVTIDNLGFDAATVGLDKDAKGAFLDQVLVDGGMNLGALQQPITRRLSDDEVQKGSSHFITRASSPWTPPLSSSLTTTRGRASSSWLAIHAIRVLGPTSAGAPTSVAGSDFVVAADTSALTPPSVAAQSPFAVTWVRQAEATTGEVVATRVSGDGSLVDASPVILGNVDTTSGALRPSNGSGAIVWDDGKTSLSGVRMTSSGDFVSLGKFAKAPAGGSVSSGKVTWTADISIAGGFRGTAAWLVNRGSADPVDRLMVAPLARDGASVGPATIATGPGTTGTATVTGNDHEFLVLWSGRGVRIGRDGRYLDATPFAAPPAGAAASDGTDFAVVWSSGGDILGAKIAGDGTVGPSKTLVTGPSLSSPAIASNGTNYVVVWLELATTGSGTDYLHEAVLDLSLDVQHTAKLLSTNQGFTMAPRIASDGQGYMVTVPAITLCTPLSDPNCAISHFQIVGTQLQADGTVVLADDWQILGGPAGDQFTTGAGIGEVGGAHRARAALRVANDELGMRQVRSPRHPDRPTARTAAPPTFRMIRLAERRSGSRPRPCSRATRARTSPNPTFLNGGHADISTLHDRSSLSLCGGNYVVK